MLYLGVKSRYTDLGIATKFSGNVELHEEIEDLQGKNFKKQVEEIKKFVGLGKIKRLSIHMPMKNSNGEYANPALEREAQEYVVKCIELARNFPQFEIPIVIHAAGDKVTDKKEAAIRLGKFIDANFTKNGIIPSVENGTAGKINSNDWFYCREDFEELIKNSKRARITFDICHFFLNELNYTKFEEFIMEFKAKIVNIHVADADPSQRSHGFQIGSGKIDFDRVFQILKDNIEGEVHVIPEVNYEHENNYKEFEIAYSRLKKYI